MDSSRSPRNSRFRIPTAPRAVRLFALLVILIAFLLGACSPYGLRESSMRTVVGVLYVTGNEPFTRLALEVKGSPPYLLRCPKEVEAILLKNQGRLVRIHAKRIEDVPEGKALIVSSADIMK